MAKRNFRNNNTYLIEGNPGDNPKLMGQSLSDGRDSLYLEFYLGYEIVESKNGNTYKKIKRNTERLGLYLWQAPRTPFERAQNKETLEIAKRLRFEWSQKLLDDAEGYRLKKDRVINFHDWYEGFVQSYRKSDKNKLRRAHELFKEYLSESVKYNSLATHIKPSQLTKEMIQGYTEYLESRFNGETPHTLYSRFKKVIKAAVDTDVIRKNPCNGVSIKIDKNKLTKDILSLDEIKKLIATPNERENPNIRRAFIFCLYCGLRWCDVKDLTYANVDFSNRLLHFEQNKTKGRSSASGVVIPLNDGLLKLIGRGTRDQLIFPLPSHTMCLKALRRWVKRAGIDKHITWHCARHSFATNILSNGANVKTVASLLGHSDLRHTEKYLRAVDSLKEAAINSLPELKI